MVRREKAKVNNLHTKIKGGVKRTCAKPLAKTSQIRQINPANRWRE